MLRRGGYLLLAAVSALAAACTVDGTPTAQPTSPAAKAATPAHAVDPDHITAKDALGDFATVDACGMVSIDDMPTTFPAARYTSFSVPRSVDTCGLYLSLSKDASAFVEWGMLEGADSVARRGPWQHTGLGHGMSLLQDEASGRCTQFLVFADDITMNFTTTEGSGKPTGLCTLGRALVDLVVKSLPGKQPAHRTRPASSLTHQDACKLLAPELAATFPGATGARTDRSFPSGHLCHYVAQDHLDIELVFTVEPAHHNQPDGAEPVTIGGRPSYQNQDYANDDSGCSLTTTHVPFTTASGDPANEGLALLVFVDGKSATVCADAAKIAEQIWRQLPA